MKTIFTLLTALLLLLPNTVMAEEEEDHGLKVIAWDFSNLSQPVMKGDPCAELLAWLMGPRKNYRLLNTSAIVGPPGVVYTLQDNRGEIGILKCGTAGGHEPGEGGSGGGGCGG